MEMVTGMSKMVSSLRFSSPVMGDSVFTERFKLSRFYLNVIPPSMLSPDSAIAAAHSSIVS